MPIAAKDLTYTYLPGSPFEHTALKSLDLTINEGEYLGVIGHTGSGKTTLIKLLCGLLVPTSGAVLFDGEDINAKGYDRRRIRKKVGVVFQYPEYQLFEETIYKDIAFGPTKMGLSGEAVDERVRTACSLLEIDIDQVGQRSPFELSGGQKRRVAIAGVIAMNPAVLILDEPVAGLDPEGRVNLFSFLRTLNDTGTTIVLITHSMDDLAENAGRVLVLNDGGLAYDGTPTEVFSNEAGLSAMGLSVPEVTRIAGLLRGRGVPVPQGITTIAGLTRALREMCHA